MLDLQQFERYTIYSGGKSERTACVTGDVDRDGQPEIIIGTRAPRAELFLLKRSAGGGWQRYLIDDTLLTVEAGGALADIDGDGDLDLVAGHDAKGDRLLWWECPDDPTDPWTRREIFHMPGCKSHDQMIADLDGDGRLEVYFWNQGARKLFCVPVPDNPYVSPWPGVCEIADDVLEEGLAAADVDGDGRLELIAGLSWYRPPQTPGGSWERHIFAEGYVSPKAVAADFDCDGRPEIVISEGDASLNGREYGRLVRFTSSDNPEALWQAEVLHDRLLDPHSLQVADFDGDGRPDLFVGEMGLPDGSDPHPPAHRIYLSRDGGLEEHIIDTGVGTHESKVIELDGRVGIVCKPFRVLDSSRERGPEIDSIHLLLPQGC